MWKKLIKIISLTCCMALLISSKIYSSEPNLLQLDTKENKKLFNDLAISLVKHDTDLLVNNKQFFTEDTLQSYANLVRKNKLSGNIIEVQIDYIDVHASATSDKVVMYNMKLKPSNETINLVCMLEFHINRDGKIYGYNLWAYW